MSCSCEVTLEEMKNAIFLLAYKEKLHRDSYEINDDLVYECDSCKDGFHIVGEIFQCPKCSKMICLDCHYKKDIE